MLIILTKIKKYGIIIIIKKEDVIMDNKLKSFLDEFGIRQPREGWAYTSYYRPGEIQFYSYQNVENRTYWSNNGVYVLGVDGDVYAVRSVPELWRTLDSLKFKEKSAFVPYSNGEQPVGGLLEQWKRAGENAKIVWSNYYREKAIEAAIGRMHGELSPEEMAVINKYSILSDGLKTINSYGDEHEIRVIEDYNKSSVSGTYGRNNGVYAFVMPDGSQRVGPDVNALSNVVENHFKNIGLFVPLSNGEVPTDKTIANQWEALRQNQREELKRHCIERSIKAAKERMHGELKPEEIEIIKKYTISSDGLETVDVFGYEHKIEEISDFSKANVSGTYDRNNGVYVFVMPDGSKRVGPYVDALSKVVESHFKRGGLFVPLSNGEVPKDQTIANQWEALREIQKRELYGSSFGMGN